MKVKSITAKEIFRRFPEVKAKLWGKENNPSETNDIENNRIIFSPQLSDKVVAITFYTIK